FYLTEGKSGVDWLDADTLLLMSALGDGMATTSGYARAVRVWRRGTSVDQAKIIFETTPDHMLAWASVDHTAETPRVWFIDKPGFFDTELWLGDRTGTLTGLGLPTDIEMEAHQDWLVVKRRSEWMPGTTTYAPDSVLGISLSAY
ncbi:S9 family peptidase, partial [Lactobacillus crispatus]|uniref:S9 family peptidase n=1 Tax=Lactobacillus crispatus TaxID=47770 RepID=UPI001414FEE9